MKLIEALGPATILIEQVPGWHHSESQTIMGAVMRRLGYHVHAAILKAAEFGGLTKRERCYLVASIWPGFHFPEPTGQNQRPLGDILGDQLAGFKDLCHTKTVQAARGTSRERFCPLADPHALTILKSQARQTKDSLYFTDATGRVLLPSIPALQRLQGLEGKLDLSQVSDEIATEQLGQGVDYPLHHAVSSALRLHIRRNLAHPRFQQLPLLK